MGYFTDIFSTQGDTNSTTLIDAIEPVVTTGMNDSFAQEFNAEEVQRALKQMHPKKSRDVTDASFLLPTLLDFSR